MKFLSGAKQLPSKSKMLEDMQVQMQKHWNYGYRKHRSHFLLEEASEYSSQLAQMADIEGIPNVFLHIGAESFNASITGNLEFRKYKYTIIDDNTFRKEKFEE